MTIHTNNFSGLQQARRVKSPVYRNAASIFIPPVGWGANGVLSLKPAAEFLITFVTVPIWGSVVALLWLIVKCTDPLHPAFFYHQRTGLYGRRFTLLKLRTMVPSAESMRSNLAAFNMTKDTSYDFKMVNDPRVTRLGRFLRGTHLDELPQLINVLLGDMAIVGPRPSSVPASEHRDSWLPRLGVRPGLTGLAQIQRAETPNFEDRVKLDIKYIENQSLWLDIWIVWRTLVVALVDRKGI